MTGRANGMSAPRLIKKYANRRLYDTSASRHVTLADIRDLIVSGVNVRIVDDTSDADITRPLLLQIIVDQEQSGDPLLPELLLTQLIRFYGNPMQHMMGDYLQQSVTTFTAQQQTLQKQMNSMLSSAPVDTLQSLMQRNMAAWESLFGGAGIGARGGAGTGAGAEGAPPDADPDDTPAASMPQPDEPDADDRSETR